MAQFPEQLLEAAKALKGGLRPEKVTVRTFLEWFGAQRRGFYVVQQVRGALEKLQLRTEPDFESAFIDSLIDLAPANAPYEHNRVTSVTSNVAAPVGAVKSDPTYRIGRLASANRPPLSVKPDATLREATTKMLAHDYSQLPVMQSDRDVKGIVSWRSIGTRSSLGRDSTVVRDFMEPHQEVDSNASLFSAIDLIVRNEYVLVRADDRKISGIVTTNDLSLQFHQLAEPFLLIGEIENHIRRLLDGKLSSKDLEGARDPSDDKRSVQRASDLTFGEYLRLIEMPEKWTRLALPIDRAVFVAQLERLRQIRNNVMHFDPDGPAPSDLESLRNFARFMQGLQTIGLT
jgi:predicted transcriptional regulator